MLSQDSHLCTVCSYRVSVHTPSVCLLAGEQRAPSVSVSIIYEALQGVTLSLGTNMICGAAAADEA